LVLSPELASRYGIKPGARIHVNADTNRLYLYRSPHSLAKLYIEPTSQCNLECVTCIRNDWEEPMGKMSDAVFDSVIEGLRTFSPPPAVFFGGFGEPLSHPRIVDMVAKVKTLGAPVELITNATMLTPELSRNLIKAGLDTLWVSLDGATPESYSDIRLGALLPQVLENLRLFREASLAEADFAFFSGTNPKTKLGIAFVAMKRNIADLPAVIKIGQRFGAERFSVTNVLPYTKDMISEVLYYRGVYSGSYRPLRLPGMDAAEDTYTPVYQAMRNVYGSWVDFNSENAKNRCPFIESGAGAISWDGNLSPCLPLLHSHTSYLGYWQNEKRSSRRWAIGNVAQKSLPDLWRAPEHIAFRERVQAFDFAPCVTCSGCELSENNEEDCFGNSFPTCGGCLWAQGMIQCP
jgi:MoaA/NifB/PqqE/SkfB family radical SAM enzyme